MPARVHFFTDADNTLWDTNAVYAQAQLSMLREMERTTGTCAPSAEDGGLAFLRQIDQLIAATHPDHLRYPPSLLALALESALKGESPRDAIARAAESGVRAWSRYADIVDKYLASLSQLPSLRRHVREGLSAISSAHIPVTVVSEERLDRCERLLQVHALRSLVGNVVSIFKTPEAYQRLKEEAKAERVVMVGDQLDRDIRAAAAVGFETFYFPSGFQPHWISELEHTPTREISEYDQVVPYVLGSGPARLRA